MKKIIKIILSILIILVITCGIYFFSKTNVKLTYIGEVPYTKDKDAYDSYWLCITNNELLEYWENKLGVKFINFDIEKNNLIFSVDKKIHRINYDRFTQIESYYHELICFTKWEKETKKGIAYLYTTNKTDYMMLEYSDFGQY